MPRPVIDSFSLDWKQASRRLRRNPAFTLAAVLSVALGIGANTAVFRVINAVRLRSLPVPNPNELVQVKLAGGTAGFGVSLNPKADATFPLWREIARNQKALPGAFAWGASEARFGEDGRLVRGLWLSPQAFRVLGVPAVRGRMFESDDGHCDSSVAIISQRFWLAYFGGQGSAVGSRILLDERPLSVIGIAPEGFFGLEPGRGFDVAAPLCARQAADPNLNRSDVWWLVIMGRRAPNLTVQAADAQIRALSRGVFDAAAPEGYDGEAMNRWRGFRLSVVPAARGLTSFCDAYEPSLWILFAIAAMVLVIACSNISNLLLAQAKARETEVAVRLALGMSRARLAGQLLTENLWLAILGTAAGTVAGSWVCSLLVSLVRTSRDPVQLNLETDWRTVLFSAVLAVVTCLLLGFLPLLRLAGTDLAIALREGGRSRTQSSNGARFQHVLIGSQLAISLVLLVTSVSFVRSFRRLTMLDAGFRQDGLVFCFADFSRLRIDPGRIRVFQTKLLGSVRRARGVELAARSTHVPLTGDSWTLGVRAAGGAEQGPARFSWVSGEYFRTLGIPLITGRTFTEHDSASTRRVLIVNQTFVRRFCSRAAAAGTLVRTLAEPGYPAADYEIVGVVRDTKYDSLREKIPPAAYAPESQDPNVAPWASVLFRASGPAASSIAAVRQSLAAVDPRIRVHFEQVRTIAEESIARDRLLAWLSGMFAALAAGLTCIGLYGVIAYAVSLRRPEIAVRMALGATAGQVAGIVAGGAAKIAAAGTISGLVLSLAAGRMARSLLFELDPADPLTLLTAAALLATVCVVGSLSPALKAAFIKPASALRAG